MSELDFEADAGSGNAAVLRVTALVELAVAQTKEVSAAEDALAAAKANLLRTTREDLPELMKELTLTELTLANGVEVSIEPDVDCAITEANRERAHQWLRDNKFGGIIKSVVSVAFGQGQEALRDSTLETLSGVMEEARASIVPEIKEAVHPATLKSFVKERMAAGATPPVDMFGIFPYDKARVKPPKAKAAKKSK